MVRNLITIEGETATIHVMRRDCSRHKVLIDAKHVPFLEDYLVHVVPGKETFYARVTDKHGVSHQLHRILMNTPSDLEVDHKDGNGLNNLESNLINCLHAENTQNKRVRKSTSGIRGVSWYATYGKWVATVVLNKKQHNLGYFDDPEEAGKAVTTFRAEHMPFSSEARAITG